MKPESAPTSSAWYALSLPDVLARLHVGASQGLTLTEVETRHQRYGPNQITERGGHGRLQIFLSQFTGLLVVILIVAAIVSVLVGDLKDAIAILAIVVLNAILGFVQEYRAEQAMAALKTARRAGRAGAARGGDARNPGDRVDARRYRAAGGRQPGACGWPPRGERQPAHPGSDPHRRIGAHREDHRGRLRRRSAAGRPAQHDLHGHQRHLRPRA